MSCKIICIPKSFLSELQFIFPTLFPLLPSTDWQEFHRLKECSSCRAKNIVSKSLSSIFLLSFSRALLLGPSPKPSPFTLGPFLFPPQGFTSECLTLWGTLEENPRFEPQYCQQNLQQSRLQLTHFPQKILQEQQLQPDKFAFRYHLGKPDERRLRTSHDLNAR